MTKLTLAFLDRDTVDHQDLDFSVLDRLPLDITYYDYTTPAQLNDRTQDCNIVITNKVLINADAIHAASALKLLCTAATGTNNVDLTAARARLIPVCNVRNYATGSVVQHTFSLILALAMRLNEHQEAVRRGQWSQQNKFCILDYGFHELSGRVLGILGYGALGKAVAEVATAFGMKVLIANRPGELNLEPGRVMLEDLLPQVDLLSLHCPLAENTRHIINSHTLALLPRHAFLINTARGGLVDEDALHAALTAKTLGGAGLDVLSVEPPPANHPLLQLNLPNLIITPHIAWAAREARQRMLQELALNIEGFLAGKLRNQVT